MQAFIWEWRIQERKSKTLKVRGRLRNVGNELLNLLSLLKEKSRSRRVGSATSITHYTTAGIICEYKEYKNSMHSRVATICKIESGLILSTIFLQTFLSETPFYLYSNIRQLNYLFKFKIPLSFFNIFLLLLLPDRNWIHSNFFPLLLNYQFLNFWGIRNSWFVAVALAIITDSTGSVNIFLSSRISLSTISFYVIRLCPAGSSNPMMRHSFARLFKVSWNSQSGSEVLCVSI